MGRSIDPSDLPGIWLESEWQSQCRTTATIRERRSVLRERDRRELPHSPWRAEPQEVSHSANRHFPRDQAQLHICYRTLRGSLQDFLAEGAERKLDRQVGGAVVLVDDRVDLDDLEAGHAAVVRDDLHGEVGLAIGGAAADGSADTGG